MSIQERSGAPRSGTAPAARELPPPVEMKFGGLIRLDPENPVHVAALHAVDADTNLSHSSIYADGYAPEGGESCMSDTQLRDWMREFPDTLRGITTGEGTLVGFIDQSLVAGPMRSRLDGHLGPGTSHRELSVGRRLTVPDDLLSQAVSTYTEQLSDLPPDRRPHALWFIADRNNSGESADMKAVVGGSFTAVPGLSVEYNAGDGLSCAVAVWRAPLTRIAVAPPVTGSGAPLP